MLGFIAVIADAGGCADVLAAGALLPRAGLHSRSGHGVAGAVAVLVEELGDRGAVLDGKESGFGDLVVTTGKERTEADVSSAAAPAGTGGDETGKFARHDTMVRFLGELSRRASKNYEYRGCLEALYLYERSIVAVAPERADRLAGRRQYDERLCGVGHSRRPLAAERCHLRFCLTWLSECGQECTGL